MLINLDVEAAREITLPQEVWARGGEKHVDLLGAPAPAVEHLEAQQVRVSLAAGHAFCLAQQMASGFGEIETAGFVDFGLHDARQDLFDRILDRDDVTPARSSELAQACVDGGRFAAARWTGKKKQAGSSGEKTF